MGGALQTLDGFNPRYSATTRNALGRDNLQAPPYAVVGAGMEACWKSCTQAGESRRARSCQSMPPHARHKPDINVPILARRSNIHR